MRHPRSRTAARLAAVLVATALVAGCAGGDDEPEARRSDDDGPVVGGTLVDLQNFSSSPPEHLDPALALSVEEAQPGRLLFDGLTETDAETGELVGVVAESWEGNEAGDEWEFRLRDGVTFHDGDPVRPSDFKAGWERVLDPDLASPLAYHFAVIEGYDEMVAGEATEIAGVVADDDAMTLTVRLDEPWSTFPAATSHLAFSPVPADDLAALDDQSAWERTTMVGNGPFRMVEPWDGSGSITLERYEEYWGGPAGHPAYLDAIDFRVSSDVDAAFQAFEAGQGDTASIPPGRFREVLERYPDQHATEPTLATSYWGFNMDDPVVGGDAGRPLRQAIALAIDKEAIVETVHEGSRQVATGYSPPTVPGYEEGISDLAGSGRDLERARALLEEWGGALTDPIRLSFNAGAGQEPVAQIIQANLADVGIPSRLDPWDGPSYFAAMAAGEGQFFRASWVWDYPSYDAGLYPAFHGDSGDNLVQYDDDEFDALLDEARATEDDERRTELYRQAEALVLDAAVAVPLDWYTGTVVYGERVRDLVVSPLEFVPYDEVWLAR